MKLSSLRALLKDHFLNMSGQHSNNLLDGNPSLTRSALGEDEFKTLGSSYDKNKMCLERRCVLVLLQKVLSSINPYMERNIKRIVTESEL